MTDIDLGKVTVALAQLPTTGHPTSARAPAPDYQTYTDEAAGALSSLPRPSRLPAGLSFLDATLIRSPVEIAIWTYADAATGRSLTVARSPLSSIKPGATGKPVVYVPGEALHEGDVAGVAAARVVVSQDPAWRGARTTLVWLKEAAVFQVSGRGLDEAELASAAESI
jgi:hypothetical protein